MTEPIFIERKPSFVLHKDSLDVLNDLTDEEAGKLFKAIYNFQRHGKEEVEGLTKMLFLPFKNQFIRDNEKWLNTSKARSSSGSKGGKQKQANASKSKQKVAKVADSVSVSDNVSVSVNENKNNKADKSAEFVNEIFKFWCHVMFKGSNTKLTQQRKDKVKARLKNYSADEIKQAISNCSKNEFNMKGGYNDLTLICRDDSKLEFYRDMTPNQQPVQQTVQHNLNDIASLLNDT